jgi:hypothetical protein
VEFLSVPQGTEGYSPRELPCGSLFLIMSEGQGEIVLKSSSSVAIDKCEQRLECRRGLCFFLAAMTTLSISVKQNDLQIFRAHANLGDL